MAFYRDGINKNIKIKSIINFTRRTTFTNIAGKHKPKKNIMRLKKIFFLICILTTISCESDKFTTANGDVLAVSTLVGMDVFDIAYEYSEVSPETLNGTNNDRWVVYYEDINVTLVTNKATNIVQSASKGKNPK